MINNHNIKKTYLQKIHNNKEDNLILTYVMDVTDVFKMFNLVIQ